MPSKPEVSDLAKLAQSPVDPVFVQNPYGFYEHARQTGPLFHWQQYNKVCALDHGLVNAVLRDRRWGRELPAEDVRPSPPHIQSFMDIEAHSMLELEAPRHTRLRGLVMRAFTNRSIARLDAGIVTTAHDLIDGFGGDTVDLLTAYGEKIPVLTIARMMGVPPDMADQLLRWSHDMVAMYQANRNRATEDAANRAASEFAHYIGTFIDQRRKRPADDLITDLIAAEENGQRLSRPEMISTCILLLNAGHEATVHAIGNGVKTLLQSGLDLAPLMQGDAIDRTVDETLRYDPPLHMFDRIAYEDMELAGHQFRRGDRLGLLLAAANRDPAIFDHADSFDPARDARKLLSFGAGAHFCVGTGLAKLEVKRGFEVLFDRLPGLRLTESPEYANRYHFHGLKRLMVTV